MAPNKFEDHIKKRLQEREIRPSAEAWTRISEQLEVSEKPRFKHFYAYAIAASFIGVLLFSILYFKSQDQPLDPEVKLTDTWGDSVQKKKASEAILETKITEKNTVVKDRVDTTETTLAAIGKISDKAKSSIDVITENKGMVVAKAKVPLTTSKDLIDTKIAEIIARVDLLENENVTVTDSEIDSLLRQAQQEILENKIFRKDDTVDALALLADVENELDKSFRDQIFDALKDGFVKVRTAVADRNK